MLREVVGWSAVPPYGNLFLFMDHEIYLRHIKVGAWYRSDVFMGEMGRGNFPRGFRNELLENPALLKVHLHRMKPWSLEGAHSCTGNRNVWKQK